MRSKQKVDWERLIFRVFGACLGIIFAAYLTVGPFWICQSIDNISAQGSPVLTLQWAPSHLLIIRHISGCLALEGGGLEEKQLTDVPCDASPVLLPIGGVDHLEAPQLREAVVLESALGVELGREAIPPRAWLAILPFMVKLQN